MAEVILFDLGNVLVEFSQEPICTGLAHFATKPVYQDPREVYRFIFHPECGLENLFDEGRIAPEEFFGEIRDEMGLRLSYEEFRPIWNRIFRAREGAEDLVRFLSGKVGQHILSNTNAIHFPYLLEQFPWLTLMDSMFLSHEMGCRKPKPALYRRVLERLQRPAEGVIFLDDRQENLVPARELGMKVVWIQKDMPIEAEVQRFFPDLPWAEYGRGLSHG
ncbi:MAG: HAD family hydrolase [Thermodesulfobacteriota bacterium]